MFAPSGFEELGPPTRCYNCYAHAFANDHGWVRNPEVLIADDFDGVPMSSPRPDDVVVYIKDALVTHSAVVVEVSGSEIVKVRGKWGEAGEIVHLLREVPPDYGTPAVLLRRARQPTTPDIKCPEDATAVTTESVRAEAAAPAELMEAAPPSSASALSPLETAADEAGASLMLASSTEVRERMVREQAGLRPAAAPRPGEPFSLPPDATATVEAAPHAAEGGVDQQVIDEQLSEILKPVIHMQLMLASTTGVERRIITSLQPVRRLTEIANGANSEQIKAAIGSAALRVFQAHPAQGDDKLASVLLFLLTKFPVKEAVDSIIQFLLNRKPLGLSRALALEAFATTVVK
jgi:hypothetical protein